MKPCTAKGELGGDATKISDLLENGGGEYQHVFWVCAVPVADYNAALVDTAKYA